MTSLLLVVLAGSSLIDFAWRVWSQDPEVRIEDAYKHLFHATRGGEHAIQSAEGPRAWLDREWATLEAPRKGEPLWEPLRPDGAIGRLHLRPYRAAGGSLKHLLDAFVASAQRFQSDKADFVRAWREFGERLREREIGRLTRKEWERLDKQMGPGYPAIHHSPEYEAARKPAYRVLRREEYLSLRRTIRARA